jgi:hypothetical protein
MADEPPLIGFEGELTYIQIDFVPGEGDPARVFRAMAQLIDAFYQVDRDLAHAVNASSEPALRLERVEEGSVRAWLRTIVRQFDDDALENLDWRPLIGQYLVRGKHAMLRWLGEHDKLETRGEVVALQRELQDLVPQLPGGNPLLALPVPSDRLLLEVQEITNALNELEPGETVIYVSPLDTTPLATDLRLSSDEIEDLLTQEVVPSENELHLLVKKPDYLGNSRWEFRLEDRSIEAKILDKPWLEQFRAGHVRLRPGDALRAKVRSEVHRGFEGQTVATRYYVLEVLGVVHGDDSGQMTFLDT